MSATTATARPVLVKRQDRRAVRTPYPCPVLLDGQTVAARDISATGLSVLITPTIVRGDIVRVTLSGTPGSSDEVATSARVTRVDAGPDGFVVGLQFIE